MATYRLLGPLEVSRAGKAIDLGGPKQRAVLAVLLIEAGRVVSTDRLVHALWGNEPPPSAIGSLQVYISNLRRTLREDEVTASPIARRTPGYLIDVDPDDLDTTVFTALSDKAQRAVDENDWPAAVASAHQALAVWRGPLLVEHSDEDWVRFAAVGFDERYAACRQNLVAGLLGTGQVNPALARARAMQVEDPLSERTCWLLMVALHRAGRGGEALEAYRTYARCLDEELGLEVGPAMRDVQRAILRQEPALDMWPQARPDSTTPGVIEPVGAPVRAETVEEVSSASLVGRTRELETMRDVLLGTRTGLRWIVLRGEAGIGKSRLAEEALSRWHARGGRISRTGCPDDDVPPWWPIRQLLRDLGVDAESVVVPPDGVDVDAARFLVYDRVLGVLAAEASGTPLLLLIDDVHWADVTSLQFLTHLAEARSPLDLAVVVTVRDGVDSDGLSRLLAAVARLHAARTITLPPLSADEVAALANRVSEQELSTSDALELAERTGGNPFFVCEYARLPEADRRDGLVPVAVRSVLGRRLSGLDPEVLSLLRIAALCGGRLDVNLLAAVARLDRDDLSDLLDDAADEHIIVVAPGTGDYAFAHGLLRDEIVSGLSPLRQQRLHLRIAEAVDPTGGSDQLVRRASHLVAALPLTDPAIAFEACRDAALDAERSWQSEAAAQWWQTGLRAYDLLPAHRKGDREEILIAQAAALARAGRGRTVLELVDSALLDEVRAGRVSAAGRLAVVPVRSAGSWPWAEKGAEQDPLVARLTGIEALVREDPRAHARVLAALACGVVYDPEGLAPERFSRQALDIAERIGDPDVLADALLGRVLAFSGIAARAQETLELVKVLRSLDHTLSRVDAVLSDSLLSMAMMTIGEPDRAEEHIRRGAAGSDALALPTTRTQLRWAEATLALWRGDLPLAQKIMDHAAQLHAQTELYHAGTHDVARTCLHWAAGTLASVPDLHPDLVHLSWAAAVVAAARDAPGCDALLAAEVFTEEPLQWVTHGSLTAVAHSVCDRGLVDLAGELVARLMPYTTYIATVGQVGVVGPVDLALSRLNLLLGDLGAARDHLTIATDLSARTRSEGGRLHCLVLAQRLALEGGRAPDADVLRAAAERADRLGFSGIVRAATALQSEAAQYSQAPT